MVASVLSVAGGGPAQAANTAAEELKDTNADNVPDARLFAGGHRYQTAELLAGRFADLEGGVSSVIIANGVSQVDAVAAAGLAGSRNAAVLLTRPGALPHNVARFVSGRNVTNVTIVGGTAAVSEAVETTLKGLASKPTVTRLAGANRFATAAMIGNSLGGPNATWCGSNQRAAILVNGRDAGMSDAVVAGPLAYRLGLPMLLTEADELPAETRKFLVDNRVERVVVIGGTTAVSAGVINTLTEEVGVANAPRISGANAAATSVAVAKEMRDACKDELNVDPDRVALLSSTATADGIAAAPVLGRGLAAGGGSVPILLVGSALPAEVRGFLATTPNVRAGKKTHMNVVAVGGKAVVTDAVMTAAVEAATTGGDLTAKITFKVNPAQPATKRQFTVTFSDAVNTGPVATNPNSVLNPDLYRINGRRLSAATPNTNATNPDEGVRTASNILLTGNTVTVTLGANNAETDQQLKTGDKIEVIGGGQVGAAGDKRKLKGASLTITAPAAATDTTAPRVEIIATANTNHFEIILSEANLLKNANRSVYIASGGVTVTKCTAATCTAAIEGLSVGERAVVATLRGMDTGGVGFLGPSVREKTYLQDSSIANSTRLILPGTDGKGGVDGKGNGIFRLSYNVTDGAATNPQGRNLLPGDVIEVKRNTFLDKFNRGNALTRLVVPAPTTDLRISTVTIGDRHATADASATIMTGATTNNNNLKVTASKAGIAAGAAGNGWRIFGWKVPTADPKKAVDIDVDVDTKNKIITYTWRNGAPSVLDLAKEFAADTAFAANFSVASTLTAVSSEQANEKLGTIVTTPVSFTGGKSAVAARFDYNQNIQGVAGALLAADLLKVPNIIIPQANRNWSDVWTGNNIGQESRLPTPYNAVSIKWLQTGSSVHFSLESAELVAATKLPTRNGGPWVFRKGPGASHHANDPNTCGIFGRPKDAQGNCPSGVKVNMGSDDPFGQQVIIRSLRYDATLVPF